MPRSLNGLKSQARNGVKRIQKDAAPGRKGVGRQDTPSRHQATVEVKSRNKKSDNLQFADDIVLTAASEKPMKNLLDLIKFGMEINCKKTKFMIFSKDTDQKVTIHLFRPATRNSWPCQLPWITPDVWLQKQMWHPAKDSRGEESFFWYEKRISESEDAHETETTNP